MFYPKSPFWRNPLVESQLIERNAAFVSQLLPWLCQTPTVTTYRVNLLQTTATAYRQRLEQILAEKYAHPPRVFLIPEIPEIVCIDKVEIAASLQPDDTCKEVMVDSCCGAALLRGAHVYAPGVLAMETGTKRDDEVAIYADLARKCKRGTNTRFESPHKLFVGKGVAHLQRYQLYKADVPAAGVAVSIQKNISGVPALGDLSDCEALLQNLPSIVCVRVLDPQPGEHILDMCAAPGNKTTHVAEMMRDEGVLVALDRSPKKVAYIEEKIKRNGLTCVRAFAFDATIACDATRISSDSSSVAYVPPFAAHSFDRILLDAPCSALGNRPLLASSMTPKVLQSYPIVQRKLFAAAVPLLRTHGVLVYSTCTVTGAENENMVAWALQKFPQLQLVAATPILGGPGLPELGLDDTQRKLVQRFGPAADDNQLDTVGFFVAKFVKRNC